MKKPRIEYYWSSRSVMTETSKVLALVHHVNWRLVAANGEVLCQCTQGFRDKADAVRNVQTTAGVFRNVGGVLGSVREVGPGRKPKP